MDAFEIAQSFNIHYLRMNGKIYICGCCPIAYSLVGDEDSKQKKERASEREGEEENLW